jgi:uncharacterized protein (TIGR03067 family)
MNAHCLLLVTIPFAATADPPEDAAKALARLEGRWKLVCFLEKGEDTSPTFPKDTLLTVKGWEFRVGWKGGKESTRMELRVPEKGEAGAIDFITEGDSGRPVVLRGIYALDDEILKICRPKKPEAERPKAFRTDDTLTFMVWKRVKD